MPFYLDSLSKRSLGTYLRTKRLAKNLSQLEVSNYLGLKSSQFISNIERGQAFLTEAQLAKVIKLYGLENTELKTTILGEIENTFTRSFERVQDNK